MSRTRMIMGAVVVVMAVTVTACLDPKSCTQMGTEESRVGLTVPDTNWRIVEFCVSGVCETTSRVAVDDEPWTHPFTAMVVDPEGQTIERSGDVTTVESRPNGKGCPPQVSFATVAIAADGTVTTRYP